MKLDDDFEVTAQPYRTLEHLVVRNLLITSVGRTFIQ